MNPVVSETFSYFDDAIEAGKNLQKRIARIVDEVFVRGTHYGSATGGDHSSKPTLLGPGAADALSILGLVADYKVEERFLDGESQYSATIRCEIRDAGDRLVAVGLGAANTLEKKWRYRKDWKTQARVVNPDPLDLQNNVLKYGKKRALVDAVMGLGFSAYFMGDTEEASAGGDDLFGAPAAVPAASADPLAPAIKPAPVVPPAPKPAPVAPAVADDLLGTVLDATVAAPPLEAPKAVVPEVVQDGKPQLTGEQVTDVNNVAALISARTGEPADKIIQDASKFDGNEGFKRPSPRHSTKWLGSTLSKLMKRLEGLDIAAAAPRGDLPF